MKLIRVLVVVVFLLGTGVANRVLAAGPSVGFIRLLSSVSAGAPIQAQTRQAFERMRPRLLALQKQGLISEFEPDLRAGIVKVKYTASPSGLAGVGTSPVYDNIHDAVVRDSGAKAQAHTSLLSPEPIFYPEMYGSCFDASNLGTYSQVVGSLRDRSGRIVASYEGFADVNGSLYQECFPWSGSYADVTPGYTLTFNIYDSTPTLLETVTTTAPRMSFTRIKNSTAFVGGRGPAGKPFEVDWYHLTWDAVHDFTGNVMMGNINAKGQWGVDMGPMKFHGGDELYLYVTQTVNFQFGLYMPVPHIHCQEGSNYCEISGFLFQPATLTVARGATSRTYTGKFDATGYFSVEMLNAGKPIFLKAGDRVRGTNVAPYKLPVLTASLDFASDIVTGKVPANRYFESWAYTLCSCSSYLVYTQSDGAGNYVADFSSQVDMLDTDANNIETYFVDPATGNITNYVHSYGP